MAKMKNIDSGQDIIARVKAHNARKKSSRTSMTYFFGKLSTDEVANNEAIKSNTRESYIAILQKVSDGFMTLSEGTKELALGDIGNLFQLLREENLPFPRVSQELAQTQLHDAYDDLVKCLVDPAMRERAMKLKPSKI